MPKKKQHRIEAGLKKRQQPKDARKRQQIRDGKAAAYFIVREKSGCRFISIRAMAVHCP